MPFRFITPTDISLPLISSSIKALSSSLKHISNAFIISFFSVTLEIPKLDPPVFGLIKRGRVNLFKILSVLISSSFLTRIELGIR